MSDRVPAAIAKQILVAWPGVAQEITRRLVPLVGLLDDEAAQEIGDAYAEQDMTATPPAAEPPVVRLEDASAFVQHMAAVEGQIRMGIVEAGCNCQMEIQAHVVRSTDTDCVVQVFSAHDTICGLSQKTRLRHPELDEQPAEPPSA